MKLNNLLYKLELERKLFRSIRLAGEAAHYGAVTHEQLMDALSHQNDFLMRPWTAEIIGALLWLIIF